MDIDTLSIIMSFLSHKEWCSVKRVSKLFNNVPCRYREDICITDNNKKHIKIKKLRKIVVENTKDYELNNFDTRTVEHLILNNSTVNIKRFPSLKKIELYRNCQIDLHSLSRIKSLEVIHIDICDMNYKLNSTVFNLPKLRYLCANVPISLPAVYKVKSEELECLVVCSGYNLQFKSDKLSHVYNDVYNQRISNINHIKSKFGLIPVM